MVPGIELRNVAISEVIALNRISTTGGVNGIGGTTLVALFDVQYGPLPPRRALLHTECNTPETSKRTRDQSARKDTLQTR